jgi:hypothetical protein
VSWRNTVQPMAPSSAAARSTTRSTAGVRPSPRRCSAVTTGFNTNVNKIANATGIRTVRAH